jgi:desulfoferrodoxin (superoxide reductase-like protein)
MRGIFFILISISFLLLHSRAAVAHPPSKIVLEFNAETSILKVAMTHEVKDAAKHYIEKIEIKLNDKEILVQDFLTQQDTEEQTALYHIHDAKQGDTLEVTAHCNVFGKEKETLQIP